MPTLALPGGGRGARAQLRGRPAAGRWPRSPGHHVQGKRGDAGVGSSAGTKLNRSRGQAQRCTSHRKQRGGRHATSARGSGAGGQWRSSPPASSAPAGSPRSAPRAPRPSAASERACPPSARPPAAAAAPAPRARAPARGPPRGQATASRGRRRSSRAPHGRLPGPGGGRSRPRSALPRRAALSWARPSDAGGRGRNPRRAGAASSARAAAPPGSARRACRPLRPRSGSGRPPTLEASR
mmetsp:Transcript_81203/g.253377  ORF Transcript_81203/g.253377 Transcript_81203/m.253377 type:complete len:239 (-) Transcript_81203:953-1669(-)